MALACHLIMRLNGGDTKQLPDLNGSYRAADTTCGADRKWTGQRETKRGREQVEGQEQWQLCEAALESQLKTIFLTGKKNGLCHNARPTKAITMAMVACIINLSSWLRERQREREKEREVERER